MTNRMFLAGKEGGRGSAALGQDCYLAGSAVKAHWFTGRMKLAPLHLLYM